jgi:hypothetical protein
VGKLAAETRKAEKLMKENQSLKETLMANEQALNDREYEINERDVYIDQLEQKISDLEAELLKKDMLLKTTKGHTKGSRSTNINPLNNFMKSGKKQGTSSNNALSDDLPGRDGSIMTKKNSFIFNNPVQAVPTPTTNNRSATPKYLRIKGEMECFKF